MERILMAIPTRTIGSAAALKHIHSILVSGAEAECNAALAEMGINPAITLPAGAVRIGDNPSKPLNYTTEIRVLGAEFRPGALVNIAEGRGEYSALVRIYTGPTARTYIEQPTHETDTEMRVAALSDGVRALIERLGPADIAASGIYNAQVVSVRYADVIVRATSNTSIPIRRAELRVTLNTRHRNSRGQSAP